MYIVEQVDDKYYISTACGTRISYYKDKVRAESVRDRMNNYDYIRIQTVVRKGRFLYAVYIGYKELELFQGYERALNMKEKLKEAYNMGYIEGKKQS